MVLALLLAGCSRRETQSIVVWTDRPELAAYLELFNAEQSRFFAELKYQPNPLRVLRTTEEEPDLIISVLPTDTRSSDRFRPLDSLLEAVGGSQEFYTELLQAGRVGQQQLFIPLSFDLPVITFKRPPAPDGEDSDDIYIEHEEIRRRGAQFNRYSGGRPTHMGFSPRWNPEFLYLYARLNGLEFRHSGSEDFSWESGLPEIIGRELADWIEEANQGVGTEQQFERRYLNDPQQQLLIRERILFAYDTISGFAVQPAAFRAELEFRWPMQNGQVPVLDEIVHLGILRSGNTTGAEELARWLLDPQKQELMIRDTLRKQLRNFGLAGGFSSRASVNEGVFPRHYPYLSGRIPPPEHLLFPGRLPSYWPDLREAVILPYLQDQAGRAGSGGSLESRMQAWLLRRGD